MIKNFDEIKRQLSELAPIINSFTTEAVQLRIVELVLKGTHASDPAIEGAKTPENKPPVTTRKGRRKKRKPETDGEAGSSSANTSPKRATGDGAPATLERLVAQGFFSKPKTLGATIQYCETDLARRFKQNEFSGKLARLVRAGTLKRNKNADGHYEYIKA